MTILPESVVIASEEYFSFMVPASDVLEALELSRVPDDFIEEEVRGLPIIEVRITKRAPDGSVRLMYRHPVNPKSRVRMLTAAKGGS